MHIREFGNVGNGAMMLPALTAWPRNRAVQFYTVFGGPYPKKPILMDGVLVAAEFIGELPYEVALAIPDFQTPLHSSARRAVDEAVKLILAGNRVYVGCKGGQGRTGLFLALLAKTFGLKAPVEYVRDNYYPHAVETKGQYDFVQGFEPDYRTVRRIRRAKWRNLFKTGPNLTRVTG